jgi:hypothetical protein
VVVGSVAKPRPTDNPTYELIRRHLQFHHPLQRSARRTKLGVEHLGLPKRAREAVEDEAALRVRLANPLQYDLENDRIRLRTSVSPGAGSQVCDHVSPVVSHLPCTVRRERRPSAFDVLAARGMDDDDVVALIRFVHV